MRKEVERLVSAAKGGWSVLRGDSRGIAKAAIADIREACLAVERMSEEDDELLATCKTLLEICRWKCSFYDEVVLRDGRSNHLAIIDACEVIAKVTCKEDGDDC